MDICVSCKYGHECPFVKGEADLFHAYMYVMTMHEDLSKRVRSLLKEIEEIMIRECSTQCGFGLMVDIESCDGYEPYDEEEKGVF